MITVQLLQSSFCAEQWRKYKAFYIILKKKAPFNSLKAPLFEAAQN